MIIDTHAHLVFPEFKRDLGEVFERARRAGIAKIINVGCSLKSSEQSLEMAAENDFLYATLGLHPYDAKDATEELMDKWKEIIRANEKVVAIGECGLDYFKANISRDEQIRAFRLQLELAQETKLPVIVHNREADEDCLELLSEFDVKAVFHCYGGDLDFAEKVWEREYMTSFTGIITFPKALNLHKVVKEVPMDKFMVETDCPYLAPQSHRGERNEPAYVVEVLKRIAELKEISVDEVSQKSSENALGFFVRLG